MVLGSGLHSCLQPRPPGLDPLCCQQQRECWLCKGCKRHLLRPHWPEKLDNPARRAGLAGRAPPPAAARGEARGEAKPDDKPAEERYVNKVAVSKASKARSRYHRQRKSR